MKTPKVWVYTICWNEAAMMPWFLRHYGSFAERIVVWDERSADGTREILEAFPTVEVRDWPWRGLDDERFLRMVNSGWKEARGQADWVMWPDVDEILWHPSPLEALASAQGDVIPAVGYAMITRLPIPTHGEQIYHTIKTGHRQDNYDKRIIWRPDIEMTHTIGRHTYPGQWPRFTGQLDNRVSFKLLHYHYFGVEHTKERNRRNYERAVNKRYAWNYDAGHNDNPLQNGSVAWVRRILEENLLEEVI